MPTATSATVEAASRRRGPRPRRTQEERSAETRARLLDATIECLYELGYGRTTTTEISERAGVSRGAQLHHFPTKASLVMTAVEHLFLRRHDEFRRAMAELPADADRADSAVDLLWKMLSGPTFYAWLELLVAARTDETLRASVAETSDRFGDAVRATFAELFPDVAASAPAATRFVFNLLEGMALQRITEEKMNAEETLALVKTLARMVPGVAAAGRSSKRS